MRTLILFFVAVIAALTCGASVAADNMPTLGIVVEEPVGSAAQKCGLSKSAIESVAVRELRNNGIRPAGPGERTNPFFYVRTSAAFPTSLAAACAISVRVEVTALDASKRKFGRFATRNPSPDIVLCSAGGVATASTSDASSYFAQAIELYIKNCLGQLEY